MSHGEGRSDPLLVNERRGRMCGGTPEEFTKIWMDTSKQLGHVIQERHITIE